MNKLYILRPIEGIDPDPWEPWYDKAFGFIVEAGSAQEARSLASKDAGCEAEEEWDENYERLISENNPWLNPKQSTCKELKVSNKPMVIMRDFHAA